MQSLSTDHRLTTHRNLKLPTLLKTLDVASQTAWDVYMPSAAPATEAGQLVHKGTEVGLGLWGVEGGGSCSRGSSF